MSADTHPDWGTGIQEEAHQQAGARTLYKVRDVLEGARLLAIAVDGERLSSQRLGHEVADHAAVVQRHVGAVCVEDPHHAHLHTPQLWHWKQFGDGNSRWHEGTAPDTRSRSRIAKIGCKPPSCTSVRDT